VFVKVDGVTTEEDALLAVAMGADAVGFIFAPSPRQVAAQVVSAIVRRLPQDVLTLGVFVNEAPQRVVDLVRTAGLQAAQLHGHESADETRWVRQRVGIVLKAFPAGDSAVRRAAEYDVDAVIIDNPGGGGSGEAYDWSLAEDVPDGVRLVLAGGLTPENVADAIAGVRPWGVDVSSGVESSPGRKDPGKLRAFIANAKALDYGGASVQTICDHVVDASEPVVRVKIDPAYGPAF
jgi:phosphoribosylanthranilate isomerase